MIIGALTRAGWNRSLTAELLEARRQTIIGDMMSKLHLVPPALPEVLKLENVMVTAERTLILAAIKKSDGNRTAAARLLGISHRSLLTRGRQLDILDEDPQQIKSELPDGFTSLNDHLEHIERKTIIRTLEMAVWNLHRATEELGLNIRVMRRKMQSYGIEIPKLTGVISLEESLNRAQAEAIQNALDRHDGAVNTAAKDLDISRRSLLFHMRNFGIGTAAT